LLKTALTAKLTKRGGAKSWKCTPELKVIRLLKNNKEEEIFSSQKSVERGRVKPKPPAL
jgi:hypothetical protein